MQCISVYASVWASWSAWSFCVNNVRVRVRACNTVRGFSCLGANQAAVHEADYDAVDPWEADRKEAMRQLYPDYVSDEQKQKPKIMIVHRPNIARYSQRNPGHTAHSRSLFRTVF
uniref:Uncharacterized protein n=1 Tax=Parascaris equorum TaxID=6256 RepID=A0A914R285_PAREQ